MSLRGLAGCGGCAAKAPPALLEALRQPLGAPGDERLLAGLAPFDDAAVYRLDDGRALVTSVDFFPPVVDDPADYGAIAATNAISDIYAMGGDVVLALAVSGFPATVPDATVAAVNRAAADVIAAHGGQVVGGHSIRCAEPVFGLAVHGFVEPAGIWRKAGAEPAQRLLLSKPVGTGVLLSRGQAADIATATAAMRRSNRDAARCLRRLDAGPGAVTDVTGFGLLGHAAEVAAQSGVRLVIDGSAVPLLDGARAAVFDGATTSIDAALADNRLVQLHGGDEALRRLLYDPQTSGGLLATVPGGAVAELLRCGFTDIGAVEAGHAAVIVT